MERDRCDIRSVYDTKEIQSSHCTKWQNGCKGEEKYILQHFKYREYAENFSQRIKKALKQLDVFPTGYETTGFQYRGYDIYIKPDNNHLLFFTVNEETAVVTVLRVLQDGMDWEYIIRRWLERNNK